MPALSLESILEASVVLLDEAGEGALTFRSLAARLDAGVGSIYWYVSSKDELLDRATDAVMAGVLADTESIPAGEDPIANLRALGVTLYGAMEAHPWVAAFLMRDVAIQPHSIALYERFGQQAQRLPLTRIQRFHAVSAIVSYVVGVGAEMGQAPDRSAVPAETLEDREAYLADAANQWLAMDPEKFPFLHEVAQEFASHQDEDQFVAGLDLLLAGLSLQAGSVRD